MTPGERLAQLLQDGALVCDAEDVAAFLDTSTWSVYDSVRKGTCPIPALHVGRRIKFRVADCAALFAPVGAA